MAVRDTINLKKKIASPTVFPINSRLAETIKINFSFLKNELHYLIQLKSTQIEHRNEKF